MSRNPRGLRIRQDACFLSRKYLLSLEVSDDRLCIGVCGQLCLNDILLNGNVAVKLWSHDQSRAQA